MLFTGDEPVKYANPSVARTMAVLEYLAESEEPHGVSAIARDLGLAKSTCFGVLATLERLGYAKRDAQNAWSLSLRLYHVGMRSMRGANLLTVAQPELERLRDATGLTVNLGVLEDLVVRYALKIEAPVFVRFNTYPGKVASYHLTATARTIAAFMAPATLDAALDGYRFEGGTPAAVRNRGELQAVLDRVRADGFDVENGEETTGVCCVAAPIRDERDQWTAAVSVTGLTDAMSQERLPEVTAQVLETARSIERELRMP